MNHSCIYKERLMLNSTTSDTAHTFADTVSTAVHHITTTAHTLAAHVGTFLKSRDEWERECEEAYLAEAVDGYDLEYRMREIDRRHALQLPCLTGFSH
jgi:hypothetical protein